MTPSYFTLEVLSLTDLDIWHDLLDPSSSDRKYLEGTHQTYLVKSAMKKPLFKELYNHCNGFRLYVDSMKKYI